MHDEEYAGTICPICRESICRDMDECEAEYNDVGYEIEDDFQARDEKMRIDRAKAIW